MYRGTPQDAHLQAIGRWGEEHVFRHLTRQLEQQQQQRRAASRAAPGACGGGALEARAGSEAVDRVVWVNRERESYLPYDLYISHADDTTTYIEVKASASKTKDLFEISLPELRFAEEQGARYELYRVRGAGGPSPIIVRLGDPISLLRRRAVSLCLAL
ncbi:hypothetical protein TSOC_003664 [Tetrabaena socialis]|uniref:Protein NO VEIN C-terminal domain-containing protein n=1 Tax=Tetrabaena socialis TaxID=47790 RepID=A0A2J8AAV2_9CHLO|nr:hypothetical protein TSOC_003664 [Tetrabaena socialis]|eukprot:PNH09659.1 hypothetical protein TSOC_003664 [Tetrabaena socialis]